MRSSIFDFSLEGPGRLWLSSALKEIENDQTGRFSGVWFGALLRVQRGKPGFARLDSRGRLSPHHSWPWGIGVWSLLGAAARGVAGQRRACAIQMKCRIRNTGTANVGI